MKELPDEQTLLELLAMAKDAEKSAREACELSTIIAHKWQKRLQERKIIQQK